MTDTKMQTPDLATDFLAIPTTDTTGCAYTAYESRHLTVVNRPLIVYMGLGTTALTAMGAMYLRTYASVASRPVITLHPHQVAWESFAEQAKSDAEIIAQYGRPVDIIGASSGGLLASYVAAELGNIVRSLITVSAVGTHSSIPRYIRAIPGQLTDGLLEIKRMRGEKLGLRMAGRKMFDECRPTNMRTAYRTLKRCLQGSLGEGVEGISPETYWLDVVGSRDNLTNYLDHQELVDKRNNKYPRSSSLLIVDGQGHMWASGAEHLARIAESSVKNKKE